MSILFSMFLQRDAKVLGEVVAEHVVFQRVIDGRLQIAELLAGVVALALEDVAVEVAGAQQLAKRVGELNLAAGAALGGEFRAYLDAIKEEPAKPLRIVKE